MARKRGAAASGPRLLDDFDDVVAHYRKELAKPATLGKFRWSPTRIGPTWETDGRYWHLPEHSIGWDVLGWAGCVLQHGAGHPWRYTPEQARFILWWYAVDETGDFLYRDGVLQRLKGWGKDPVGATICASEALGPARVIDWENGEPVAADVADGWVQTAAVSLEQTKNTMRLMPSLFPAEARSAYRIQVGKIVVHALGDTRLIEAVTSSPATLEGARSTFVLLNETHLWTASNSGHDMSDVIERNATKSPDGAARTLRITNAYEPGEDSVAERDRDAYELVRAGAHRDTGLLYDSLEAHPEAPLTAEAAPAVVRSIRGDSDWLDIDRIVSSILDSRNPVSRSRRFWYNQIWAAADSWVTRQEWDALPVKPIPSPDTGLQITLGFDGSVTDDWSALIGCVVETDHLFAIGIWDPAEHGGEAPRELIDGTVHHTFAGYDVVGFYSDLHPWESYVDAWAEELGAELAVSAASRHKIAWDMRSRKKEATFAAERMHAAIVDGMISHDGNRLLARHVYNARRRPNAWGVAFGKEHRESAKKVDALSAATLARQARLDYLALPEKRQRRKKTGKAVFL